ncbi:MAG: hypothetical protein KC736_02585 [Candidatus Moranbacteria bacterium]|nr:hypothetical protein [Candidatus Moranbacteria bacterium]
MFFRLFFAGVLFFCFGGHVFAAPLTSEERRGVQEERAQARQEAQEERKAVREQVRDERQADLSERFCERFSQMQSRLSENMIGRVLRFEQNYDNRLDKLEAQFDQQDARLANRREQAEEKRSELFSHILSGELTDEQRDQVLAFQQTVQNAVSVRHSAVDEALSSYRSGVLDLLSLRKTAVDEAVENYSAAVSAAVEDASSLCGSEDFVNVRLTLQETLSDARDDFRQARESVDDIGENIRLLADVRRDSVHSAFDDFRVVMDGVRLGLEELSLE